MVFCGLYPTESDDYEKLRDAIGKLKLNDAALSYLPETSSAMGFGFRCGFLGLLHMDIVQERLEREYDLDLIVTAPSVVYKIIENDGREKFIDTPSKLPDPNFFEEIQEPYVRMEIMTPTDYTGSLMDLGQSRRGTFIEMKYMTPTRTALIYEMPLAEVITDFFDELKSRTKGKFLTQLLLLSLYILFMSERQFIILQDMPQCHFLRSDTGAINLFV